MPVPVERVDAQEFLHAVRALVGEEDVSALGVDGVVLVLDQVGDGLGDLPGGLLATFGAGED